MFFSCKPKNRRSERVVVLDVKLRSQARRANRWRFAVLALTALVTVALVYTLGERGWQWLREHAFYNNQAFALNTIEVQTDGWITPDQVRQWAGVKLGDNLLAIDLDRIKRDLELIPQVERAVVERVLPHLLRLHVTEREPIAQVQGLQPDERGSLAPAVFYLDAQGVAIPPLAQAQPHPLVTQALAALPVIRGVSSAELRAGQPTQHAAVRTALGLVTGLERSPLAGLVELRTVELLSPDVLLATTSQGGEVTLGTEDLAQQLRRWRLVHEAGLKLGRAIGSLDLSVSNNCPLSWLEAGAAPPPKGKPVRFLPHRKKHV
jgi:cell division septal protein FtsQ